jgi:hypothetical protein
MILASYRITTRRSIKVIIRQQNICRVKYIKQEAARILVLAPNLSNLSIQQVPHENLQTHTCQSAESMRRINENRSWKVNETNLNRNNDCCDEISTVFNSICRKESKRDVTSKMSWSMVIRSKSPWNGDGEAWISIPHEAEYINPAWSGIKIRAPNSYVSAPKSADKHI